MREEFKKYMEDSLAAYRIHSKGKRDFDARISHATDFAYFLCGVEKNKKHKKDSKIEARQKLTF